MLGGIGRHFLDLRRMAALRLPHARVNGVPCVCQRMRGQAPKPLDAPVMTMMFFMDRQTLRSRAELARSPSRHPGRPERLESDGLGPEALLSADRLGTLVLSAF